MPANAFVESGLRNSKVRRGGAAAWNARIVSQITKRGIPRTRGQAPGDAPDTCGATDSERRRSEGREQMAKGRSAINEIDITSSEAAPNGLLFGEKTTARPIGQTDGPQPTQKLSAPTNLDFEDSEPRKPPAGWQLWTKLRRYDFQVATADELPHTGSRCAVIGWSRGRHYGEFAGAFSQQIDATPYRGESIRLRAAARAETLELVKR
jgi:hypothetical protein